MKLTNSLKHFALALACTGMVAPQISLAAQPAPQAPVVQVAVTDVVLHEGNMLAGQLVNAAGAPLANAPVTVSQGTRVIAATHTTNDGVFAVRDLKGGVYTVDAAGTQGVYRVWTANMAPPTAKPAILMVQGNATRGQFVGGILGLSTTTTAIVGGGIVAGGVVIYDWLDDAS